MHEEFEALYTATREALAGLGLKWAAGDLDAHRFEEAIDEILIDAHTRAVVIGRTHAGDDAPEDEDDFRFAAEIVEQEHDYLQTFVDRLEGSDEFVTDEGQRDGEKVAARAASYAGRLRGTANEAWGLTLPPETLLTWSLGPTDHCSDCLELEGASPYTPAEIPTYPGQNETLCLQSCGCSVFTAGGQRGFSVPP